MVNDKYIGRLLDNRYEILEVIGVGGMAVVYKARCHRLNRLVAVKILKDDYCSDDEFRRRFHAEGQAVAMVSHPNIVSVYDVSTSHDADYIVMELIDGISLKQYMEKKGVLNWKETLHFAIQIGKAMEHAHGRGIVHRDIKPHNVMVLKNGSVKVADFGIARVMSESNTLTREALGSVHYISPEQAKGGRVDNRSDIYSLGVVMYEMMTGRPPYNGESPVAVAIQHINGGAAMPSTLNPNIPGGLEQIIMKAMAHDPAARYDTATAMLYDMDEFRKNPVMLFDYNTPPTDAVLEIGKNNGAGAVAAGAAGAAAVAAAAVNGAEPVSSRVPQNRTTAERVVSERTEQPRRPAQDQNRRAPDANGRPAANSTRENANEPMRGSALSSSAAAAAAARRLAEGAPAAQNRRNTNDPAARRNNSGNNQQSRQRKDAVDEDDNKAATIAIFACSAVAVIALIVFLVVLLSGGCSAGNRDTVVVPNLVGRDYEEVLKEYKNNKSFTIELNTDGSLLEGYVYSDKHEKGKIVEQTPSATEEVNKGTVIKVKVSAGPEPELVEVPDLLGDSEAYATQFLTDTNLKYKIEDKTIENEDDPVDIVIDMIPAAGTQITSDEVITLVISRAPEVEEWTMEDFTDPARFKNIEAIEKWLEQNGMDVTVETKPEENMEELEGTILRTEPAAGETIKTGDVITVYVAAGLKSELMIPLEGMTYEAAVKAMETMVKDLDLTLEMVEIYDENTDEGCVVKTEPAATQYVKTGETVKIYVCAPEKAKMPDVLGMGEEGARVRLTEVYKFSNIRVEYKTSDKPKNTVYAQSVAKDTEITLDTEIILYVSTGQKTLNGYVFGLWDEGSVGGEGDAGTYRCVIKNLTTGAIIYDEEIPFTQMEVILDITGYGEMTYVFLADGELEMAYYEVNFDNP